MKVCRTIALAALIVGCRKAPPASSEGETKPTPAIDAAVPAVAVPPDAMPASDCSQYLDAIRVKVGRAYMAKDSGGSYRRAVELWPGVPETCRNGEWYVFGAKLLAWASVPKSLEANGVILEDRDQALAAAVSYPLVADDLAYVALVAGTGGTTQLPANACQVAESEITGKAPGAALREATDAARYICGHAELATGDAAGAKARFDEIEQPAFYPDIDLRRAEVELALGNKKEARLLAKKAAKLSHYEAKIRFASTKDWEAIVTAAKSIAK
jgi:hypothetical protein